MRQWREVQKMSWINQLTGPSCCREVHEMKPKHTQAIHYLNQGLFEGLTSFGQLEDRIRQLDTPQARGDAFEVFAEAYFAIQRVGQA
jgi:hypothetical protein